MNAIARHFMRKDGTITELEGYFVILAILIRLLIPIALLTFGYYAGYNQRGVAGLTEIFGYFEL